MGESEELPHISRVKTGTKAKYPWTVCYKKKDETMYTEKWEVFREIFGQLSVSWRVLILTRNAFYLPYCLEQIDWYIQVQV